MVKKRIIGVITVKDRLAVQSFGYKRYLPLGNPSCIAENLDRWGVDEILVQAIDRSENNLGPDFELLSNLGKSRLSVPIIYGGGVANKHDAIKVIHSCADRITLDSVLHQQPNVTKDIADTLGSQAVIAALPVSRKSSGTVWYHYGDKKDMLFSDELNKLFADGVISEALIVDWVNEGFTNKFNHKILDDIPFSVPCILFGGISEEDQIKNLLSCEKISAVAIGNFLNYREHSVQKIKQSIDGSYLRPAQFLST